MSGPTLTSTQTAALLDVHSSTVKRWCNDGELPSDKTAGGHRRIQLADALALARAQGIETPLSGFQPYEAHVWSALREVEERGEFGRFHRLAMGWVHRGQHERLGQLVETLSRWPSVDLCTLCDEGVRGLMARVGGAWHQGKLRAGEEHIVSQVMLERLIRLRSPGNGAAEASPRRALVGSMEGNQHHLGAYCVRLVLEERGWDVTYLGPDVPLEDFAAIQKARDADLVCVSLSPPGIAGDLARAGRLLAELYDPARPYALAFGGQGPDADALTGPFVAVAAFEGCAEFAAALAADWHRGAPAPGAGTRQR